MATISGSFTDKGASALLSLGNMGERVSYAISNTFVGTWRVERSVTPDGTAWEVVFSGTAAASGSFIGKPNERYRVRCYAFTSGDMDYSISDAAEVVFEFMDLDGNPIYTVYQDRVAITGNLTTSGSHTISGGVHVFGNVTVDGYLMQHADGAATTTGTTRDDATLLSAKYNRLTSVPSGTGVVLPVGVIGREITVFNDGDNPAQVYALASESIDGTAGATGVALTNAKRADFIFMATNSWRSAQRGVVSA